MLSGAMRKCYEMMRIEGGTLEKNFAGDQHRCHSNFVPNL